MKRYLFASTLLLTSLMPLSAISQATDEEQLLDEVIVVTAMRVTQGGAQDIEYFRETVQDGRMPAPSAITSEGLLSTHDMVLERSAPCDQLFCLSVEAMPADFLAAPDIDNFMGLGFATNISAQTWTRAPTTVMAVVDTSGSMGGEPLELAQASMREVLAQLRPGDRMGIAHYGDTTSVVMPIRDVSAGRSDILEAIDGLESDGATYMEAGLELAFNTAIKSKPGFEGTTRVILFTDEQPNVGNTNAESFIGIARRASHKGVGLTTIGVADHFGADLANQISAARGGNLFYVENEKDVSQLFGTDFDFLVTEVAHDLRVKINPAKGVDIAQVYGLPGEELKYHRSGAVSFVIPSVFLSSKGGGIFLGFDGGEDKTGEIAKISMSYVSAADNKKGGESLTVTGISPAPSKGLKLGHLLVDEFQVLQNAAHADAFGKDLSPALDLTQKFQSRLEALGPQAPEGEAELIDNMIDILEEGIEEAEQLTMAKLPRKSSKQYGADREIYGAWKIQNVKNTSTSITGKGSIDLREGDLLAFGLSETHYDETETFHAQRLSPKRGEDEFESESMQVDTKKRRIKLFTSDIEFRYAKIGERLKLRPEGTDLVLTLVRPSP